MRMTKIGEWFWRFLAVVMMFSVAWTMWIIYQLNPPPLIMNAAYEAAAKARGRGAPGERRSAHGIIAPAPVEASKQPPINPEKLKFSESIALPVPTANK